MPATAEQDSGGRAPTVFLVLDPVTAGVLHRQLEALLGVGRTRVTAPDLTWDGADVLIASGDALWAWIQRVLDAPGSWRGIYVQPELLIAAETVVSLWPAGTPAAAAWERVRALDRELRGLPILRMETAHGGGEALRAALIELLGDLPWGSAPALRDSDESLAAYGSALDALTPPWTTTAEPTPVPGTGRFPVRIGGAGLRFLHRGWSRPEPDFTWSNNWSASLLIPGHATARTCVLSGWLVTNPLHAATVSVRVNGGTTIPVAAGAGDTPGLSLDVPLPASPGHPHRIELLIGNPVRPVDVGVGSDRRLLGFALGEVVLSNRAPEPARPELELFDDPLVRDLLARQPPALALVVATDPSLGGAAAEICRHLGCPQVLVVGAEPCDDASAQPLPVATGVHTADASLETLGRRLGEARAQVELAVLCDPRSVERWFAAVGHEEVARGFVGASLVIASGDPYASSRDFHWYASRCDARIQVSERVTVAEAWAAA